ncbi:ATP-binding protein [Aeromonas schubertii]|uniref:sensor histidine kinase n=1 Tax=Aeromonas TaxID=642 RepID=UPI00067E97AF|nr:ATP-binding protein [Aeromonas schubertii]KUE81059.1 hypothetical protein ATO46_13415 [Aeromonas schubertii]
MREGQRGLLFALWAGLMVVLTLSARHVGLESLHREASQHNDNLSGKLEVELDKYRRLPALIATRPELMALLQGRLAPAALHPLLEQFNEIVGTDAIYLMSGEGNVLAASNWQRDDSFVGDNYRFRPYFLQAMSGQAGSYFALGQRSGKRGYYFSYPIMSRERPIGVVVVKVSLSLIDEGSARRDYLLTDEHGVVFYSSRAEWLYRPLTRLDPATLAQLALERKYGDRLGEPLTPFDSLAQLRRQEHWEWGQGYLFAARTMPEAGWHLYTLVPLKALGPLIARVLTAGTLIFLLLLMIWLYWRQILLGRERLARLNNQLEQKVAERTRALSDSNGELTATVEKFRHTQRELIETQEQLVQAAKLAVLGELSAGINHELNQPLAAMRTYAENALRLLDKGRLDTCRDNLVQINDLNRHMGELIARFKVFARKGQQTLGPVHLQGVIQATLALLHNQMIRQGVLAELTQPEPPLWVEADPVQLEQVLVNLLHNALQATEQSHPPRIWLRARAEGGEVVIEVEDNGPGLAAAGPRLFEPFFTTKAQGLGLGLALSRRLVEGFGGRLEAQPARGALFRITLNPAATPGQEPQ